MNMEDKLSSLAARVLLLAAAITVGKSVGKEDFHYEAIPPQHVPIPARVYAQPHQGPVPPYLPTLPSNPSYIYTPPKLSRHLSPPEQIVEFTEITAENIKDVIFGEHKKPYTPSFDLRHYNNEECLLHLKGYCVTVGDVNDAVLAAYPKLNKWFPLKSPSETKWNLVDIGNSAEYMVEISALLADKYQLVPSEVISALPLIDTSKTLIRELCPKPMSTTNCKDNRYRRIDSWCNNPEHPEWGASMATYSWLLPPEYSNHVGAPKRGYGDVSLPSPRRVSSSIHRGPNFRDAAITTMFVSMGQFVDHDMIFSSIPIDPKTHNPFDDCCTAKEDKHPSCYEYQIDPSDYLYGRSGKTCESFLRLVPGVSFGCKLGQRASINRPSSFLDLNTIYGPDEGTARKLRALVGGKMKTINPFKQYRLKDVLPLQVENPDSACIRPNKNTFCFISGDNRVNENIGMGVLSIIFVRQHNAFAEQLHRLNPHWNDEKIYQTARHINIGTLQHIVYNEFIPILLGERMVRQHGLFTDYGSYSGYDVNQNAGVLVEFAAAAFRIGHSLVPSFVERRDKNHNLIVAHRLSSLLRRPFSLLNPGYIDQYILGHANQLAYAADETVTSELRDHMFQKDGAFFGFDLIAANIQRGRDVALRGFMEYRKTCGLPVSYDWNDLYYHNIFPNETIARLRSIYQHVDDIDLWTGGVSERPMPDGLVGPTFACILATQFYRVRYGDRYWYENLNYYGAFTPDQVKEIYKSNLAAIICDQSDDIVTIQKWPLIYYDYYTNPRLSCRSYDIPRINLAYWKEEVTHPYP